MSVLTVTDEPLGAAHGVYRRQNQLLGLPEQPVEPPGYGDDVPQLWQAWNGWLDGPGARFGISTARTHPHWSRQGWARSQALVRYADRELMWRWFDRQGLRSDDVISPSRLLAEFRAWLAYRGQPASHLLSILTDRDCADVLTEVLAAELQSWDGAVRDRHGHRSVHGLVVWDAWTGRLSAALRVSPDLLDVRIHDGQGYRTLDEHDDLVLVDVEEDPATLLGRGSSVRLSPELTLRVGGDPAYLFAEDDAVAGLVQQRVPVVGFPYRALVRDDAIPQAVRIFDAAGSGRLEPRAGPVPGWSVLEPVRMVRPVDDPNLAGLGPLTPRPPTRLSLQGGLNLGGRTWVVSGVPDLVVPLGENDRPLLVDGQQAVMLPPSTRLVSLRRLLRAPGEHEVAFDGQRARLRLVCHIHELPSACSYGYVIDSAPGTRRAGAFTPNTPRDGVIRGALVQDGVAAADLPLARTLGSLDTFVLTEQGRCLHVDVRPPPWLADMDLDVRYVEVLQAARGIDGTLAFFLHRQRPGRPFHLVELTGPPPAGPSRVVAERPDVVADLFMQLKTGQIGIQGQAGGRRLYRALQAGLRRGAGCGSIRPAVRRPGPQPARPTERGDRLSHVPSRYDDVLAWASELEGGEAEVGRFRDAWEWLCRRDDRAEDADRAALELYNLEVLGHVEQDRRRRRFGVTPAVANVLAGGGGYAVLCGARPPRLLERLRESDHDTDPCIQRAGPYWDLHLRSQLGSQDEPIGPAVAYLEWDPDHQEEVLDGLRAAGVQVVSRAGDRLLDLLVPLQGLLATAPALTMSPSARFERWEQTAGGHAWTPRTKDATPGLYRYTCWGAPVFAWRDEPDDVLRVVDKRIGYYLQHARGGRTNLLHHDSFENRLIVPRSAPLPPLTARAVVLRTGLLPQLLAGFRPTCVGAPGDVFVYRNIDRATAERVGRLLGQTVIPLARRIEECQ